AARCCRAGPGNGKSGFAPDRSHLFHAGGTRTGLGPHYFGSDFRLCAWQCVLGAVRAPGPAIGRLSALGGGVMDTFSMLLHGFGVALQPINIMWALVGSMLGTAIGILPGI